MNSDINASGGDGGRGSQVGVVAMPLIYHRLHRVPLVDREREGRR